MKVSKLRASCRAKNPFCLRVKPWVTLFGVGYFIIILTGFGFSTYSNRLLYEGNGYNKSGAAHYKVDKVNPKRANNNLFREMFFYNDITQKPKIVSINISKKDIQPGEKVTIDIFLNEAISGWSCTIDAKKVTANYLSKKISYTFIPIKEYLDPIVFNYFLKDQGYNKQTLATTLNLSVESLSITANARDTINIVQKEFYQNKKDYQVMQIVISKNDVYKRYIENILISCNKTNYLSQVYLKSNNLLFVGAVTKNGYIFSLNTANIVATKNISYGLYFNATTTIPLNTIVSFSVSSMITRREASNKRIFTPLGLKSGAFKCVSNTKTIVTNFQTAPYVNSLKTLLYSIGYEPVTGIPVAGTMSDSSEKNLTKQFVADLESSERIELTASIQINKQMATSPVVNHQREYVENEGYVMEINEYVEYLSPRSLLSATINTLEHNHRYALVYAIPDENEEGGYTQVTSNEFLVDLTPPLKPNKIKAALKNNANLQEDTPQTTAEFELDTRLELDPESGLSCFRLMEMTGSKPYWRTVTENAITSDNTLYPLPIIADEARHYTYQIQNNAGEWSPLSEPIEIDIRANSEVMESLFNNPNPFDSRMEMTDIYYTLNENAEVEAVIYSIFGYFVKRWNFNPGFIGGASGVNKFSWDGTNAGGDKVSRGVYLLVIKARGVSGKERMLKYKIAVNH